MEQVPIQSVIEQPLFTPTYLNIEYIFVKIVEYTKPIIELITDPDTWSTVGVISVILSIIFIAIIIFSVVRIFEIQAYDRNEINHEIHLAAERNKEKDREKNPRWHYILSLIESPNESDWRVAIMEADSMMEDLLKERGLSGENVSELLEGARGSGYRSIQDAWNAHLVRNRIAHEGSEFQMTQLEGRRAVRMFQNFFEELGIV